MAARIVLVLAAVCVLLTPAYAPGATACCSIKPVKLKSLPVEELSPEKGMFLVARRGMSDPNFRQTVVLLLKHGSEGTLGLVVNRRTPLDLLDVAPSLNEAGGGEHRLFFGGPVALNAVLFLVRSDATPERAEHVVGNVYFSGDRRTLETLLAEDTPPAQLHLYAGHAGWSAGQLDHELKRGDWHLVDADPQAVFAEDSDLLWHRLIERYEPAGILALFFPPAT